MMEIVIRLLSDATFGRGEGTAGEVDMEVEHDEFGLPYIGGKALRGLLRDEWLRMAPYFPELHDTAQRLLGVGGLLEECAILRVGNALLPDAIRVPVMSAVRRDRKDHPISPRQVLRSLTDIRIQTAEDRETGAPLEGSLRSSRVVIQGLQFHAPLEWLAGSPTAEEEKCLAMCVLAVRHGGAGRNRGRGFIECTLDGDLEATRRKAGLQEVAS